MPARTVYLLCAVAMSAVSAPLAGAVEPTENLVIKKVELGRSGPIGLAFKIDFADKPDPARLRIFFDVDGPAKGEDLSGADYMVEGSVFYRYPPGATGWKWEPIGKVSYQTDGVALVCLLQDASMVSSGTKVVVQTTTPTWEDASRWPATGQYRMPDRASLPEIKSTEGAVGTPGKSPAAVDMTEMLRNVPRSLSIRFADDFLKRPWRTVATAASPSASTTFSLVFRLVDARTGKSWDLSPVETLADGPARLLKGTVDGLDWEIVTEPGDDGVLTATGRVRGAEERCFSLMAAAWIDPVGWRWHADVRDGRLITADKNGKPYATLAGSPYGAEGQVSIYPFGVISRGDEVVVAETDITEPRVMRIAADAQRKTFGITWDMAISPGTKKFPGSATFRASWRRLRADGPSAFRRALQDFYERQPDFARNRATTAGLWMPFADISKLPKPEDFGFAFFEKVGEAGSDVDYAHTHGVLTMRYTEPWLYWLPMPKDLARTSDKAVEFMRQLAHSGDGHANSFAAAGLLGGAREQDGSIRMKFQDVPWNSGARMEVSTDPGLVPTPDATVSRAMAEWHDIQGFLSDPRTDGVYLDSMSAMQEIDYNPAAIAVADYPLTFTAARLTPGLSTQIANFTFTAALGNSLHARGKLVMGNFPAYDFPFFMPYVDVPGEETVWFTGGKYVPLGDAKLNYRRAMAGRKVWCFLLGAKFEEIPEGGIERYFQDCLFYGFEPSFFSHNGSDDTYWSNPGLYERDRPLFQKYIPLIRQTALAGWQPLGTLQATDEALWIENFGDGKNGNVRHATLRNASSQPLESGVAAVHPDEVPLVALEPLTGATTFVFPGAAARIKVSAGEMRLWDLSPLSDLRQETEFLDRWASPGGEGRAGAENLRAVARETAAGLYCRLDLPNPAVQGEDSVATLEVRNGGPGDATLDGFGKAAPTPIPAGKTAKATLAFREVDAQGWLNLKWQIKLAHGSTIPCARRLRVAFAPATEVSVETERVVSRAASAGLGLTLLNRSASTKKITVHWEGDFPGGETNETLAGGETKHLQLAVPGAGREKGFITVSARVGGAEIFRKKVYVLFTGENASAAVVSGVQVVTDSTYPGYSPAALTDGVVDGTNLPWNEAAWASDENGQPHFVRITFPDAMDLNQAAIYWHQEDGVRYTSLGGTLVGTTEDGASLELGAFTNLTPVANTLIRFPKRRLKSVELRIPANAGAKERPGILWLSEFEVK